MMQAPPLRALALGVAATAAGTDLPAPETHPGASSPAGEWVRRARQGCPESFARLVEQFGPRVYHYLYHMTGNAQDAEDLTQDTFLKAYRTIARCRHPEHFVPWLLTIARRTGLNHFRAARPTQPFDQDSQVDPHNPASLAAQADESRQIWEIARALHPKHYEVLWLYYAQGLSVSAIAAVTRRPLIYVRVLLHRARRQFAERFIARPRANQAQTAGLLALKTRRTP